MKDKAFARAVSREDISAAPPSSDLPLDTVIQHVIAALRADAPRLGLGGETPASGGPS